MIYDITQPLFECEVYPGSSRPEFKKTHSIDKGDLYNETNISLCVHNGTHVDAPIHFLKEGKGIDQIDLSRCIGTAYVAEHHGEVTGQDAERILSLAKKENAGKKILIKGDVVVSLEAAEVFAKAGIDLLGNESQTVGPEKAPMKVHLVLLNADVVLLEGIRLKDVKEGAYMLYCAPLNLKGSDGSPCRAVLSDME